MMTGKAIAITGLMKNQVGSRRLLAWFNVSIAGVIEIRGCMLVRLGKNGLVVAMPRLDKDDPRRGVKIVDAQLLDAVKAAALDAYRMLGGNDGLPDWAVETPTEVENKQPAEAA